LIDCGDRADGLEAVLVEKVFFDGSDELDISDISFSKGDEVAMSEPLSVFDKGAVEAVFVEKAFFDERDGLDISDMSSSKRDEVAAFITLSVFDGGGVECGTSLLICLDVLRG